MTPEQRKTFCALKEEARQASIATGEINGWLFLLSHNMPGFPGWHLSASLRPLGRSSLEQDWRFIGQAVAVLGAPEDALLTPLETTDPNDPLHWHWDAAPAVIDTQRRMLADLARARAAARAGGGS